jgi:hypothetical protein
MTRKDVVVLQNCADVLDAESGSRNWTCPASHDENQDIDVKVEVVTNIQEEEDPLLITIPVTRAENEVRLDGSVCSLQTCTTYSELPVVLVFPPVCLCETTLIL